MKLLQKFLTEVEAILTYGSSVLRLKIFKDIDRVLNRAWRYNLGFCRSLHSYQHYTVKWD